MNTGERKTHAQIARALKCSRGTVQAIERRALLKLRLAMGSSFRGVHVIYDVEGRPEPALDGRDYERSVKHRRRMNGRFAR